MNSVVFKDRNNKLITVKEMNDEKLYNLLTLYIKDDRVQEIIKDLIANKKVNVQIMNENSEFDSTLTIIRS